MTFIKRNGKAVSKAVSFLILLSFFIVVFVFIPVKAKAAYSQGGRTYTMEVGDKKVITADVTFNSNEAVVSYVWTSSRPYDVVIDGDNTSSCMVTAVRPTTGSSAIVTCKVYYNIYSMSSPYIVQQSYCVVSFYISVLDDDDTPGGGGTPTPVNPPSEGNGTCGDNVVWSYSNHTLEISGNGSMDNFPSAINGNTAPWKKMKDSIYKVVITGDIKNIGDNSFKDCGNLKTVELNSKIEKIGLNCFMRCTGLETITLPDGLVRIEGGAFCGCSRLNHISIPVSTRVIDSNAFMNCTGLSDFFIPKGITYIGKQAFDNTPYANDPSHWENGVLYLDSYLLDTKTNISGNYLVKDGTTVIAERAFYQRSYITGVTIPDSVIDIGYATFQWCNNLSYVTIGNGVKTIPTNEFYDCKSLKTITMTDSVIRIDRNAFANSPISDLYFLGSATMWNRIFKKDCALSKDTILHFIDTIRGDADGDGAIAIYDATAIQRKIADYPNTAYVEEAADADGDGSVTVLDATAIQRHLAGLSANEKIGKPIT